MLELLIYGTVVIVLLIIIYRSGKNKDGFVRYFSRGAYMRDLNEKIEKRNKEKLNDKTK